MVAKRKIAKKPSKRVVKHARPGQPTLYKSDFCALAVLLGAEGKSFTQIAAHIGVSRESIYEWARVHPEFSDALSRARMLSQSWWEDAGQKYLTMPGFQASMWAKNMSCRFPDDWRDITRSEQTGKDGGPIAVLTMEQIAANPNSRITLNKP